MTDLEKRRAYLARIGYTGEIRNTAECLRELHYRHALTVPYENLDILQGKPLELSPEGLFAKIVLRGRGGYCFELNGGFGLLCRLAGFETEDRFARFLRGETEIPMHRHRMVLVTCEGKTWVCDVGVGSAAPRYPLLLEEGLEQTQGAECYRFTRDAALGWVLLEKHGDGWRRYVSFSDERMFDVDYIQPSYYCEKHPDSPFNKKPIIAVKTPEGRRTVDGNVYKVWQGETVTETETLTPARYKAVLAEVFGLAEEER